MPYWRNDPLKEGRCFAIKHDHLFVTVWEQGLDDKILEFVQRHTSWTSMSIYHYGQSRETAKPTVVVSVPDMQDQDYEVLE